MCRNRHLRNSKGEYIIEGYGVDPDIEVENDPKSIIAGRDPQLERAIAEMMKKIATPVKLPETATDAEEMIMNQADSPRVTKMLSLKNRTKQDQVHRRWPADNSGMLIR